MQDTSIPKEHMRLTSDEILWEASYNTIEGTLLAGVLRWPSERKEAAELSLDMLSDEVRYSVVLQFDPRLRRFEGIWRCRDMTSGTAWCQIARAEDGRLVLLEGRWTEAGTEWHWSAILTTNELFDDD